jgi:hypothetical protein
MLLAAFLQLKSNWRFVLGLFVGFLGFWGFKKFVLRVFFHATCLKLGW